MDPSTEDVRFIEPPSTDELIPSSLGWEIWLIMTGALLVVMLAAWFIWRQGQRSGQASINIHQEAHAEAISALAACTSEEPNPVATECSLVLRRYMAKVTDDPALFETHEEWLSRHEAIEPFGDSIKEQIHSLFSQLAEWKYTPAGHGETPNIMIERSRDLLEAIHEEVTA